MNYINFDNASTTKASEKVINSFVLAQDDFFNPSSLYLPATKVKLEIEKIRAEFLSFFNANPKSKFLFTSCASEANNAILRSAIRRKDKKAIVTMGEHSSVFNTAKTMQNEGFDVDFAPLDSDGKVNLEKLLSMVDKNTCFVSIIHVSNETGAINDIKEITKKLKAINPNILVHSDGVQAVGKLDIDFQDLGIDFYTISAHKINGIKGIAGLYIAPNVKFNPFIVGGPQELGLRAGTENYPAIKAFFTALTEIKTDVNYNALKQLLLDNLMVDFKVVSPKDAVANILSIAFRNVRGETIEHMLEERGFLVGTGSACNSKDKTNRVLDSMGIDKNLALGNIRVSFGEEISKEDILNLAKSLNECVEEYLKRTQRN